MWNQVPAPACLPSCTQPSPLHSSSKRLTSPFLHLVTWPRVSAMQVAGGVGFVVRSLVCSSCCSFSLYLPGSSELHVCPPLVPCAVSTPGCCGPVQIPFLRISSMFILPCSACVSRTCHPPWWNQARWYKERGANAPSSPAHLWGLVFIYE